VRAFSNPAFADEELLERMRPLLLYLVVAGDRRLVGVAAEEELRSFSRCMACEAISAYAAIPAPAMATKTRNPI
jgi:hypothetical protein